MCSVVDGEICLEVHHCKSRLFNFSTVKTLHRMIRSVTKLFFLFVFHLYAIDIQEQTIKRHNANENGTTLRSYTWIHNVFELLLIEST